MGLFLWSYSSPPGGGGGVTVVLVRGGGGVLLARYIPLYPKHHLVLFDRQRRVYSRDE